MMGKILLIIVFSSLIFSTHLFSQKTKESNLSEIKVETSRTTLDKKNNFIHLQGTYQIQYTKKDVSLVLTEGILNKIQTLRKDDEDFYYEYSEEIRIYIPSVNTINHPNFKALEASIILE
jgi:hypothetical protein